MLDTHAAPQSAAQLDSPDDLKDLEKSPAKRLALRWLRELENAERVFEDYHKQSDEIYKRYRDERSADDKDAAKERKYNALWSMTQTLKPLLFGETPVPFVTREHDDDDAQGRDAALLLQRMLSVKAGSDHFFDALNEAVDDYVLGGRGLTWVTYMPEFAVRESDTVEFADTEDGVPEDAFSEADPKERYKSTLEDDGRYAYKEKYEYKSGESCILESVNSKDLLHGPATRWRHVPWVARRVPMMRNEAVKRFGKKIGEELPLVAKEMSNPRSKSPNTDDFKGSFARAVVWEIWDRVNKKIIWVCPDYRESVLDERDDMLGLQGFFPCPKPMYGTMTNDTLIPVADYSEWQDIALELDDVTMRIHLLIGALRIVGVYSDEYGTQLGQMLTPSRSNQMIPISNFAMFAEKGGLKGVVDFFPIEHVIQTLDKLYDVRSRLVQEMYEITGISDIVRGASDPRETASAQKLKGSFANARLTGRQKMVARHAREALSIIGEIVCTLYSDETIMRMTGAAQLFRKDNGEFDNGRWSAAIHLLRDEPLRMLRVKIDTESLAESTIMADRDEANQFLQGLTGYMTASVGMLQMAPNMGPLLSKLMLFAVRKFRVGRALEADIDNALRQLAKTGLGQPQDEKGGGDPGMNGMEMQVEMDKNAIAREKLEIDKQKMDLERQKAAAKAAADQDQSKLRHSDVGIKSFTATQNVRLKDKELDGAQQQAAMQSNVQQAQLVHEQEHTADEMSLRRDESAQSAQQAAQQFAAMREDAAAERDSAERDFAAGRQDAKADHKIKATLAAKKVVKPKLDTA